MKYLILSIGFSIVAYLYLYEKYKKSGRSLKHLDLKVFLGIGLPILSLNFIFDESVSLIWKFTFIGLMASTVIIRHYVMRGTRIKMRKAMGLPIEDEDTDEIIEEKRESQ